MLSEELRALRLRHQDPGAHRGLVKGSTQSWKERTRSVSSSDVLGDIERSFFQNLPPTDLFSDTRPLHQPHCDKNHSSHCNDAQRSSHLPSPYKASPYGGNSRISINGNSFKPRDRPVLDPSNPAAFFASSASHRREGGSGGGGARSPRLGSRRRDDPEGSPRNSAFVSSPRHCVNSESSPKTSFPHSFTLPANTPTGNNTKSRLGSSTSPEPSSPLPPSHSTSEASSTVMAQRDSAAPLGLPKLDNDWLAPALTNPKLAAPRTRSTGSLGRFSGLELLRQLQAEEGKAAASSIQSKPKAQHVRKPTFSWYMDSPELGSQTADPSIAGCPKGDLFDSDILTCPGSMNLPLQSPRGFPGIVQMSDRREVPRAGSFQETQSPRRVETGSSAVGDQFLGDVPLILLRGAGTPKAPQHLPGLNRPDSASMSFSLSGKRQSTSPATVPGATVTDSSCRMVRRSSYSGMDWWQFEQEQLRRAGDTEGTVPEGSNTVADTSMIDFLGFSNSPLGVGKGVAKLPGCPLHQEAHQIVPCGMMCGPSGRLVPRHIFNEEASSLSTDSSPVQGRARYARSHSSARRMSLEVDITQISLSLGTPQDTDVAVKTPPRLSTQKDHEDAWTAMSARPSAGTPQCEADRFSSPMLRRNSSRRSSACASPLGRHGSPVTIINEGELFLGTRDGPGGARGHGEALSCWGGMPLPHQHTDATNQQPLFVQNLQRMRERMGKSGPRSGPIAMAKAMSWNEERGGGHERVMPPNADDTDSLPNPFTWKELEESCRKLDEANIRIAGIDLTDVASNEGEDHVAHTQADAPFHTDMAESAADVAPDEGSHMDTMLLSPATLSTQKCTMPWELPPKSPTLGAASLSQSLDNSRTGSPAEASPKLINRVLGKVRRQWESLQGNSRFLSRHGSAHM